MYLEDNQLTGPIPPEIGNLSELAVLSLNNNKLTGSVPPELGNLGKLELIRLSDNLLEGAVPHSFLALNKLVTFGCQKTRGVCLPATGAFREWARQVEARGSVDYPVDIPYCDEIDRRGLTTLYEATNGIDWTVTDGWLDEDESLDQWYGAQTDSIGRVVSLDLNSNGLSGSIPEALGMLASMKKLRIGNKRIVRPTAAVAGGRAAGRVRLHRHVAVRTGRRRFRGMAGRHPEPYRNRGPVPSSDRTRDSLIIVLESRRSSVDG